MIELSLDTLARGAAVEAVNEELARIVENIVDPNTPAKTVRSVTLTIKVKPNEQRNMGEVSIQAKSTLAPVEAVETSFMLERQGGKHKALEISSARADQHLLEDQRGKVVGINHDA